MTGKRKINDGQWGDFFKVLILLPLLPFIIVFSVLGISAFQGLVGIADKTGAKADKHPQAFINLYYLFVVGAVVVGFLFLFGVLP